MGKYKLLIIAVLCLTLCGCASWIVRPTKVVLLPEERIFTVPAGQKIAITLDKKPMEMTFPEDMKLVSPTVLVRQEEKLSKAALDSAKVSSENSKKITFWGSMAAILAGAIGIFLRMKSWLPKISAKVDVK